MKYTVLDYLEKTAESYPNKIAFADVNDSITWKSLVDESKHLAGAIAKYFPAGAAVPVMCEKSVVTVKLFFATLYAGCFYSFFDFSFPDERLNLMIKTLETPFIITDKKREKKIQNLCAQPLFIEDLLAENICYNETRRNNIIDVEPVYANFTSGSTGVPKAVVVSHRSVIDFISCFTEIFEITSDDRIANQAPFDFDVSVKDIYPALKTGATLVIVPKELFSRPAELIDFLVEHKVTTMTWAVSALCLISTFHGLDYKVPETVKRVMFSGEVMPMKHLKEWMKHLPNATFVNLYGPTEITCNCTYHIIDRNREYEKIPVGIPFNNEDVFLLDENNKLVVNSEIKGEICVRGSALALGYYKNKEQTDRAFVRNPLNDKYIEYIYRTGDLGYYENNDLYFGGRKDFQIKYMGHRIELEEIDKAIGSFEGVERVCSIFKEEKSRLYAFYIGDIEVKELHEKLSKELPVFMIPSKFVKLEEMPLTKNGKIDRKKLEEFI